MATARVLATILVAAVAACGGDILNNRGIRAHVDDLVAHHPADAVPADRWALTAGALLPIYGSYALDHRVYGELRPSAIVFDWILGAIVPVALVATSFAIDASSRTRGVLLWTALGSYGLTRVAIVVVGNLHVDEYDDDLAHRAAPTPALGPAPHALALRWTW